MVCKALPDTGRRLMGLFFIMIMVGGAATITLAQNRPLLPVVQGDLAPGASHTYEVRAQAGDLIFGTMELQRTDAEAVVTVALVDARGSRVKIPWRKINLIDFRPLPK